MKKPTLLIGACAATFLLVFSLAGCTNEASTQNENASNSASSTTENNVSSNHSNNETTSSGSSSSSSSYYKSTNSHSNLATNNSKSTSNSKTETGNYYDPDSGYSRYTYSDGTEEMTDGWGTVIRGKNGKTEEYSTDGGVTWHNYKQ